MERRASSTDAGQGVHSSNAIATSLPIRAWISVALSGVSSCSLPSRCDRKRTPSSPMTRRAARLKTWYPPLSVRIGPDHPMKRCRPPRRAMSSSPGRR